ncbi:O-antigen ligase family protein [Helicobacter mustelae]|uniref:O-antigen ligase family protein n=1 Tax=Helicobacter mustelae TaxID=217 RepID=UPI0015F114C1|nr:O-antigen ligase family protein [Helicobacter mustelae]
MLRQERNTFEIFVSVGIALTFLLSFDRIGPLIGCVFLLLVLIISGFFQKNNPALSNAALGKNEKIYLFALIGFFASALLSFALGAKWILESQKFSFIDLDQPSKYLLLAYLTWLFWKKDFRISANFLFVLFVCSGYLNGLIGLYQRLGLHVHRVSGTSRFRGLGGGGIIEFGDASGILTLFLLVIFLFARSKKEQAFVFGSIVFSYAACFMTGTRGSILSVLFGALLVVLLVKFYQPMYFKRVMAGCLALVIAVGMVSVLSPKEGAQRLKLVNTDLKAYKEGDVDTSIGLRFEMWKEALAMWELAPVFGLSSTEASARWREIMQKSQSRIDRKEWDYKGKKHNQFLNALGKRGIVGLLAILFVWYSIARLFSPYLREKNPMIACATLCALSMLCFSIIPNSFIGEIWESNVSIFLLCMGVALWWKVIQQERVKGGLCILKQV